MGGQPCYKNFLYEKHIVVLFAWKSDLINYPI